MIQAISSRQRLWLLLFILLAFARLLYHLDYNTLWWDESLSLVRAEALWKELFTGQMIVRGGIVLSISPDQHPFLYFALLKLFIAVAGNHEFALRFLAAACSTAFVPVLWVSGNFLVRQRLAPAHSAMLAALFHRDFARPAFHPHGEEPLLRREEVVRKTWPDHRFRAKAVARSGRRAGSSKH